MCHHLKHKIKEMQGKIIEKAKTHSLHSPEVVKLSQIVDEYIVQAMKDLNRIKRKANVNK